MKPPHSRGPRSMHAMAFYAPLRSVILYGGASGATSDDTWAFDGEDWKKIV